MAGHERSNVRRHHFVTIWSLCDRRNTSGPPITAMTMAAVAAARVSRGSENAADPERARSAVTRAIRQTLVRIRRHHATLNDHLERRVRTGTYCVYLPDPGRPGKW